MRNQMIVGKQREHLVIDPGPKTVAGVSAGPKAMRGHFWLPPNHKPVQLGELRTDGAGRLLAHGTTTCLVYQL